MQKKFIKIFRNAIFVLCILASSLQSTSLPVSASNNPITNRILEGEKRCWALDVVFLIDQSQSMWNPKNSPGDDPSDPEGYRFESIRIALDQLIMNRQDECNQAVHRLGVITFGDKANVWLELANIDPSETDDPEVWASRFAESLANAANDKGMKATNPKLAFEEAQKMLLQAPPMNDPTDYGPRKRVVILLTDGNPDLGWASLSGQNLSDYMKNLLEYMSEDFWQGVSTWVLTLRAGNEYINAPGYNGSIRENWEQIAKDGKFLFSEYKRQTIFGYIDDVVNREFAHIGKAISCGETFYVDPYQQRVIFNFYRRVGDNDIRVTLEKLDATNSVPVFRVTNGALEDLDPTQHKPISLIAKPATSLRETYIFEQPQPGGWRFTVGQMDQGQCQDHLSARQVLISTTVEPWPKSDIVLPLYNTPPFYKEKEPRGYEIKLVGSDGNTIYEEPNYPINLKLNWQLPDGSVTLPDGSPIQEIQLVQTADGIWRSKEPVVTTVEGTYILNYVATTNFGDGTPGFNLFQISSSFRVVNLYPIRYTFDEPQDNSFQYCNSPADLSKANQIPVRIKLIDRNGVGVNAGDLNLLPDAESVLFTAFLKDSSGKVLAKTNLAPNGLEAGVFQGQFFDGNSPIIACGDVSVEINFVGGYDTTQYFYEPIPGHTIKRTELFGVTTQIDRHAPPSINIHKGFCSNEINTLQVLLKLVSQNLPLDPKQAVKDENDWNMLYQVRLIPSDSPLDKSQEPMITPQQYQGDLLYTGGYTLTVPGKYKFEIIPNQKVLKSEYIFIDPKPIIIETERIDDFVTSPTTCTAVKGSGIAFVILLGLLIAFLLTGGPGGELVITSPGKNDEVAVFKLSKTRVVNKIKGSRLDGLGLKSIQYKKAPRFEGRRAVEISVYNTEEAIMIEQRLDQRLSTDDLTTSLNLNYDIFYR